MSTNHWAWLIVPVALAGLTGCGAGSSKPGTSAAETVSTVQTASTAEIKNAAPVSKQFDAKAVHLPFDQAIRPADQPPAGADRPPDTTFTGLSVFKVMRQVRDDWDNIRFSDEAGKQIIWTVSLETEQGPIEITMLPQLAPNHARNFIALARAGYYKGMRFDRIRQEELVDNSGQVTARVEQLEAGCPLGTGETAGGGLGYWLRHETNPEAGHAVGMVGACRDEEADTGCSRFFILLSDSPHLNGHQAIFGKVTKGLDVAKAILKSSSESGDAGKPPVLIQNAKAGSTR